MAALYLTTVVALLVTSTVLVSAAPGYKDKSNMLDRLDSLLDQNEELEQAQMAGIDQKEADNQFFWHNIFFKAQEDLLAQMILEMLTNKKTEIESVDQQQWLDKKEADMYKITEKTDQDIKQQAQHEEEMTFFQSIFDNLLQRNKKEQEIAEALKEKISQLQTIQTSLKSMEAEAQKKKRGRGRKGGGGFGK